MSAKELITEHLDLWTGAVTRKSSSGRRSNGKVELTGVRKLRELILELAVRGKLVEQNSTDEPASVLLEKIADEKSRLAREGKIKKPQKLPAIKEEEVPFELPEGWQWTKIWNVSEFITSGSRDWAKYYSDSGAIFITMGNLSRGDYKLRLDNIRYVSPPAGGEGARTSLQAGDLVVSITGDVGNLGLIPEGFGEAYINQHSCLVRLSSLCRNRYHAEFMRSPSAKNQFDEPQRGVKNSFRLSDMGEMLLPLPPLEEQHRIVQKVDELMALCDRLEQQTSDQLEANEILVDTLLGTLSQSANATELTDNWARLAAHFDTLFTTEQSIDKLKQTILQLAVMGRLVEQDAVDEPAVALLRSIESQKAELIKSGVIKRSKPLPPVSQEDHPFKLPNGWGCHRLGGLVSKLGSGSTPRGGQQAYVDDGVPFLRSQNVWNDGLRLEDIVYISEDTHTRMGNTVVYPKDILLNITGASLGRSTIVPNQIPEANVSQHVTIIRLIDPAMTSFLHLCIQSPLIQSLVWGRQVGMAIEGLSKKVLERFEMPIPPLEEQHRIVQKVNELMALGDQLKERLNQASETRLQLAETTVEQALS